MTKELVVSSSSHETKVAILEDNQVVEVYFERLKEYGLAGSIYKGRVTRVLPGMQSAFVEVGLERDAFLYVSDFFEDTEEYEKIVSSVEDKVIKMEESRPVEASPVEATVIPHPVARPEPPRVSEPSPPEKSAIPGKEPYPSSRRSRRHRPRRKGFPESKYSRQDVPGAPERPERPERSERPQRPERPERPPAESVSTPTILPGESLAKYRGRGATSDVQPAPEAELSATVQSPSEPGPPETVHPGTELSLPETRESHDAFPEAQAGTAEGPPAANLPTVPQLVSAAFEELPASPATVVGVEKESDIIISRETARAEPVEEERREVAPARVVHEEPPAPVPEEKTSPAWQAMAPELPPIEEKSLEVGVLESLADKQPAATEEVLEMLPEDETPVLAPFPEEIPESEEVEPAPVEGEARAPEAPGSPQPQQAFVRDGHRNPRYMRKARWVARREERTDAPPRSSRPRERVAPAPQIADLLKGGQEIIVQIAKEPLGKKGARITSHIALPGRYLVYMPTVSHVGVSHKIASEEERQRLKRIIQAHSRDIPGGFIVRTAGEGRSEEELRQDILFLANLWADIKAQAEKAKAPALLHHDLDLVQRILRDQLSEEFTTVWVDNESEYIRLVNWVSRFQPSLVGRVKLYTKDVPLFEQMGVQEEINKALKPKIWLKSGGYIVINQTEALVAIDVNTGKFVGKSSRLEDTIVKTNVDAIQEIVRQIRLRDLGGILVIDFIDMDERKNRLRVMAALEEALRADRAPSKILSFNEFGLVAITRKRVRQSLERTLGQHCANCGGSGFVKTPATVCSEIYTEARKLARELAGRQVTLRVNPEVGKALKARDNTVLPEIEEMIGKPVLVRNDPAMHIESFAFE